MTSGHVIVAPDKFKGSLTAVEVARHVAAGLPVEATIAVRDDVALVELAQASGLALMPAGRLDPLGATSAGTGEMVRAALDAGCRRLVLGLGGSACTDGGAGMAAALGMHLLDRAGRPLAPGGGALVDLDRVVLDDWDERLAGVVVEVASDVDNPLLGPTGAASVYARQKGASADQVVRLEAGLARWAAVLGEQLGTDHTTRAGAGAAGGVGFAAMALLGATVRPGIDVVLEVAGFARCSRVPHW
ncbi:hypothetical protein CAE01nite_25140 [Cellulomonas aerilata]|uniref:Glycerate kinase n=1 Tax=Cellulomonas aerilata TaxID=515326 RepID=A0A512DEA5_9CELL|nr:hypothetical protein CAE01nite_25140 [Cellulomonas aerilata]